MRTVSLRKEAALLLEAVKEVNPQPKSAFVADAIWGKVKKMPDRDKILKLYEQKKNELAGTNKK